MWSEIPAAIAGVCEVICERGRNFRTRTERGFGTVECSRHEHYFGGSNCSRPGGKCWSVAFNMMAAIA
jgi:hypothetical protein